jgi:preprotein translocase subunit Sec61beta
MSRKKKKDSEEETEGVKIRPELLMVLAVALVVVSILAKVFFPS